MAQERGQREGEESIQLFSRAKKWREIKWIAERGKEKERGGKESRSKREREREMKRKRENGEREREK